MRLNMNMNRKQKIVLVAGMIFLIILVVTTPRFYMHGDIPRKEYGPKAYGESGKQLDLGEAFLRVFVVVLITGGLIVLLRSGKKED